MTSSLSNESSRTISSVISCLFFFCVMSLDSLEGVGCSLGPIGVMLSKRRLTEFGGRSGSDSDSVAYYLVVLTLPLEDLVATLSPRTSTFPKTTT
jgi:hypothetical protein